MAMYEEFLSHFKHGMMKPNKYRVEFNLPKGLPANPGVRTHQWADTANIRRFNNENAESVSIKCHTATLPQRSMQTIETVMNGAPFRVPVGSLYDPVTFSFYADSRADSRQFFDLWQNTVTNTTSNTMNFWNEYVSDIKIVTLDDALQDKYVVNLVDAWPMNVGAIDLSYSQMNNFQTITVTMGFRQWNSDASRVRPPSLS